MVSSEYTLPTNSDQKRRWYATREWHCSGGELTCVRVCVPYESCESLGNPQQFDWLTADAGSQGNKTICLTS